MIVSGWYQKLEFLVDNVEVLTEIIWKTFFRKIHFLELKFVIPERLIITVNTFHLVSNAILVVSAISLIFSFIGKISSKKHLTSQNNLSLFSERFSAMHF